MKELWVGGRTSMTSWHGRVILCFSVFLIQRQSEIISLNLHFSNIHYFDVCLELEDNVRHTVFIFMLFPSNYYCFLHIAEFPSYSTGSKIHRMIKELTDYTLLSRQRRHKQWCQGTWSYPRELAYPTAK